MIYKIYTFQYKAHKFLYGLDKGHQQYKISTTVEITRFTAPLIVYLNFHAYQFLRFKFTKTKPLISNAILHIKCILLNYLYLRQFSTVAEYSAFNIE